MGLFRRTGGQILYPHFVKLTNGRKFIHSATLSGHEDWIRSLAFKHPTTDDAPLVLASGSQDATIRLWNIERRKKILTNSAEDLVDDLLDIFESSLGDLAENEEGGKQISLKHHIITVKTKSERYIDIYFLIHPIIDFFSVLSNTLLHSMPF